MNEQSLKDTIVELTQEMLKYKSLWIYTVEENNRLKAESIKTEPLSCDDTVHALAHAEVPKCQTVTD